MLTRRHVVAGLGSLGAAAAAGRRGNAEGLRLLPVIKFFAPIPIAISAFQPGAGADAEIVTGTSQIVRDNLIRCGQFVQIDQPAVVSNGSFDELPQFAIWKPLNVQALVNGRVTRLDDGRLKTEFRLWDVASGQQLAGQQYRAAPEHWRRVAHAIADQILTRLTGDPGYFDSRIAFIEPRAAADRRSPRLVLMDQDGANPNYLTSGTEPVAQPRMARRGQKLCYTQFGSGDPAVCLLDIETGQRQVIDNLPGPPLCTPALSPDGRSLLLSVVQGQDCNLFVMDLDSRKVTRLTDAPVIDTSPCYSPDGSLICFESDRGGKPQIYVMSAGGGRAQRISFGGGSYTKPVWSPRGDHIAFTKQGGESAIGIMKADGSGERILTSGFHNEGPTFAPNGRVVMFFRDPGGAAGPSLFSIDISGRNELKVPTPGYASDPAWSPLLG